jgi:flavin reductase (DIM6/NTAB) family NADH-FMN oxidoreductase RutF
VTIHNEHPFTAPESERDPVRRFRGRLGGIVSLWTTGADGSGEKPAGLTVSSFLVALGEPSRMLALVDPDSDFAEAFHRTEVAVVSLLEWQHQQLADAFAGQFPAPGGPFRLATWTPTPWGPRLTTAATWAGVRLREGSMPDVGWSALADCVVEHVELGQETTPLVHRRGRYHKPPG